MTKCAREYVFVFCKLIDYETNILNLLHIQYNVLKSSTQKYLQNTYFFINN